MESEPKDTQLEHEDKSDQNNGLISYVGNIDSLSLTNSSINIGHTENENKVLNNQKVVVKRSSRRRPIGNNKSILQSAIARKEKSFSEYSKSPKRIQKQVKSKTEDKKNGFSKTLINSIENNATRKRIKVIDQEISSQNESRLRRSQRTISSEKETISKCQSDGELVKDYLEKYNLYRKTSQLCCCVENKDIYSEIGTEPQFCSAIDSFEDKLIGCSKLVDVKTVPMLRPSTRIPFGVFCEAHIERLKKHNCCPNCGFFCTQGEFIECNFKHYFHKECMVHLESRELCPHCGDFSNNETVKISMHSTKNPVFLPVQTPHHISAKMSFEKAPDDSEICESNLQDYDIDLSKYVDLNSGKELDLVEAINSESFDGIIACLKMGKINVKSKLSEFNDGTLLHLAVFKGNLSAVRMLISLNADIECMDNAQNTPLMLAAMEHKNDILKYLLQSGSQITVKGTDGMGVLHFAAKCGNLDACKLIVSSSLSIPNYVNFQDDGGWTPLVWACEHGHIDVVNYLISKGADVTIRDVEHNTALHWAAFGGHSDIVQLLLNCDCDVNVLNVHGDTPLHISAREDKYDSVMILLARNANVFIINRNNETPLDCVPKGGSCYETIAFNVKIQQVLPPSNSKFILSNDISKGREQNPIQCYNSVDSEAEPSNYRYIRRNCVSSDNVKIDLKVTTVKSCSCEDRCTLGDCGCTQMSLRCWYEEEGKLSPEFNFYDSPLIFECNDMCSCNAILCTNRLVQKPLSQRFQLFRTERKGWGMRTLTFISKGSYVCEYVGEILTDTEADHREDDSYLFDLDNKETESFCIDAKFYGNFARFINHSCEPNLHPVKVFVEHHDLRFPKIALFAKKDIASMEELSFDYGDKFWLVKYKSFTCDCASAMCRYSETSIGETLEKYQMVERRD